MRTLSTELTAAQKAYTKRPVYKVVLTSGATSYTYEQDRILPSKHNEESYTQRATIVLSNHDHTLDDINLKGYDAVISYGLKLEEDTEYSAAAPLVVRDQQFTSAPNKLICTLELWGVPDLMAEDEASENYIPESDASDTVKDLIDAVAGATLAPFTHCKAYTVVWDDGYDELADTYEPADGFRLYVSNNRLAALRRLVDYTGNVARFEADGKVHILKPTTSGDTYDYEYSLTKGEHVFFSKAYRNSLVIPNRVVVQSKSDDDPSYSGSAQVTGYDDLSDAAKKTRFIECTLSSDDQAEDIAEAVLAKAEMWSNQGQAPVPLNVGAEVFDYIKVTDSRQDDERTGNKGYVHRKFGPNEWTMTFGFGNWLEMTKYETILKGLETYTDSGNYFAVLKVGDLYSYLDEIHDGPDLYIRQHYLHLDATGVYVSENTLYAIRVPGQAEHNLWKQDTAPTSPETGDFWLDTNYEPHKVMIWDGDSWGEATTAQLLAFGRATILRRLKAASLTADGLVVLDEVQEGTYGLVLTTGISAGKILLSKTTKDGKWHEESGVVIDATYGISLYGGEGINAFRTFADVDAYEAGTPVQVYIGTDGKFYAAGGQLAIDQTALHVYGNEGGDYFVRFYDSSGNQAGRIGVDGDTFFICAYPSEGKDAYLGAANGTVFIQTGEGMVLQFDADCHVLPSVDDRINLGSVDYQFKGGYFKSRLKIPVGTDLYD